MQGNAAGRDRNLRRPVGGRRAWRRRWLKLLAQQFRHVLEVTRALKIAIEQDLKA